MNKFVGSIITISSDYEHGRLNPYFFVAQIQIQIPYKYLRCGCKGLGFCRNNGWVIENMDKAQGTHCTKMCADSLAENTPNASEFTCPIFLLKDSYKNGRNTPTLQILKIWNQ